MSSLTAGRLVLGIDLGTSRFKAGLFEPSGKLAGEGGADLTMDAHHALRERSVTDFWHLLSGSVRQSLEQAHADENDVEALVYTSQANTFLLQDKECRPMTPLILWPDRLAANLMPKV
jgi:sugar (pentulose or hexulose) kinase